MLNYIDIIILFVAHFIGDFMFQWREMAEKKSESSEVCGIHALIYAVPFLYFGLFFAAVTAIAHFVVDTVSSRLSKRFYKRKENYKFWLTIGADQMVHMIILLATLIIIGD